MTRVALSASLIVRDEEATIASCIASIRPHVDEICVLDTGSEDGTLDLLAELAAQPGAPLRVERAEWPGHFARARTMALELASHEWVLSIDADEVLANASTLRSEIDVAEADGKTCLNIAFVQPMLDLSSETFPTLRLFRKGTGRWQGAVHECWLPSDPDTQGWLLLRTETESRIAIQHLRLDYRGERYERALLEAYHDPDTPRAPLLLAWLRFYQGRWAEVREHVEYYLERPPDADPYAMARYAALRLLIMAHERLGDRESMIEAVRLRHAENERLLRLPSMPPLLLQALALP